MNDNRIRVLHIINGEHFAGAERVQDHLAQSLPDYGYEVGFVCLKPGKFVEARRSQGAPVTVAEMRSRFDLRPARTVARLVREGNYSLVHTHTPRSALVGSVGAALSRVPLVHHVHSPTCRDSTHSKRDRANALIERMAVRRAAAAVAVSQSMAVYAQQLKMAGGRVITVPNGVPARPALLTRQAPEGVWTIGTVALFRPRKGLEVLLEAFARLRHQGHAVRLRAVGCFETAEYEQKIMTLAETLKIKDAIDWRGFQQDVHAEFAEMDLFVLPSLFGEGLPMVVLEAMSAGIPVIGTRVEGVPEVIRHGRDGLIVTPGDADDLAATICRVVQYEVNWQSLRASAFDRQSTQYSDQSMAAGVAEVYSSILNHKMTRRALANVAAM